MRWQNDEASVDAYLLRKDELYLSVDWLERSGEPELREQLKIVVQQLVKRGREVKTTHRLARLNVGKSKSTISSVLGFAVAFFGLGRRKPNTYAGIFDIPSDPRENEKVALQLVVLSKGDLHTPPL
jgi:hypothetical protein